MSVVFIITRATYYDAREFVAPYATEAGAVKACCALNQQQLRLSNWRHRSSAYHWPGDYEWKAVEVRP